MKIDRKKITKAAQDAVQRAGIRMKQQFGTAMDAELVAAGKAARSRQRARSTKQFLKTVGKMAAAAGVVAATVAVARSGKNGTTKRARD